MNPVNRQYAEMANLFGHIGLMGIHGCPVGYRKVIFQGVATGIHSASGHFKLFWERITITKMPAMAQTIAVLFIDKKLFCSMPFFMK
jgi:ABC-type uncharacterized transport system YnjBCD ATPase subunit